MSDEFEVPVVRDTSLFRGATINTYIAVRVTSDGRRSLRGSLRVVGQGLLMIVGSVLCYITGRNVNFLVRRQGKRFKLIEFEKPFRPTGESTWLNSDTANKQP